MKAKKISKQNQILKIRRDAFFTKIEEYKKLTLEELKELFNHPDKKKRPGGIYREALIEVVRQKQIETIETKVEEATTPTESVVDNSHTEDQGTTQ